jgi:hypothetical protein
MLKTYFNPSSACLQEATYAKIVTVSFRILIVDEWNVIILVPKDITLRLYHQRALADSGTKWRQ